MEDKPIIVPRKFREISDEGESSAAAPRLFHDFFDKRVIVLLGEPGSGKTTSFAEAAQTEVNAKMITPADIASESLNANTGVKTIYFDALDEYRATEGQSTLLASLIGILKKIGAEKLRIACRAADWHDGLDRPALDRILKDGEKACILGFEPLSREDIKSIVQSHDINSDEFLNEADRHGASKLLENPHTLICHIKVYRSEHKWPATRWELLEKVCAEKAKEINPYHNQGAKRSIEELLHAAGRIFAAQLLTHGMAGVSLTQGDDTAYPYAGAVGGMDADLLEAAAKRGLFMAAGPGKVTYPHRIEAEFLAARYLAGELKSGRLFLEEVLALMTANGRVLDNLRGLYGWLATLSPESRDAMIRRDPLTIITYGDASGFATRQKGAIIDGLKRFAQTRTPWFLSHHTNTRFFGTLVAKETAAKIKMELESGGDSSHFRVALLEALAYGEPLPELGETILNILKNEGERDYVREIAAHAYQNIHRGDTLKLLKLLSLLKSGEIKDENREILGSTLTLLYPKIIPPKEIAEWLTPEPQSFIGRYYRFLDDMVGATPTNLLPELLEGLAGSEEFKGIMDLDCHGALRMYAAVIEKTIQAHGADAGIDTFYRWIRLVAVHAEKTGRIDAAPGVKEFFERNPDAEFKD